VLLFGPRGPLSELAAPDLAEPKTAARADYHWTLYDLDDRPVDFARYRGKPIFLNIWATWCGPCVEEMPSIASLASNPRMKDVAFLCVSAHDSSPQIRRFLHDHKLRLPVFSASDVPPVFQRTGIPSTFLITKDGRIAAEQVGSARWDDPTVVDYLEDLAKGQPGR
jgi:thiol-disulfide isomerase/thioredoxin